MANNTTGTVQNIEIREYHSVASLTTANYDYVVPDGAAITLSTLGGSSPTANSFSYMAIIWDPVGANQILFSTYSAGFQQSSMSFAGDGTKVMRIQLVNNDPVSARILGGYYAGLLVS